MHFYAEDQNGNVQPKHYVPMAKDPTRTRPSRTTDAKKAAKNGEVWYPSVTSVLGILDKPALVNWKVDKHLETAFDSLLDDDIGLVTFGDWAKRIKARTQEKLDAAPKAGTDIHQVLEDYLFTGNYPESDIEKLIVLNCENALMENTQKRVFEKEKYFIDKKWGYAGCADLVGENWVIDYKSKQEASKFKPGKMAYPEHVRQLAAYGNAIFEDTYFHAANIFICLETGDVDFHKHDDDKLSSGMDDFLSCLDIYSRNTYKAAK